MAREKAQANELDDFERDLIDSLNAEFKDRDRIAFNLGQDSPPTTVKRWFSTGSRQLDYIIANRRDGGIPEGRITEIFGPPSIGKSHVAVQCAKSVQQAGGICIYIDTENATSLDNLGRLGVNVQKRFVFIEEMCTENIFSIIESTIKKLDNVSAEVPVLIIWDSVAASSPRAELEAAFDKDSIGLQARAMSKGLRKIGQTLVGRSVALLCCNQTRSKIGNMWGDPMTTAGGNALPFYASVRVKLDGGSVVKNGDDAIGIKVTAKTIKNKVAPPQRRAVFDIHFGLGIFEHEHTFDHLYALEMIDFPDGRKCGVRGPGAWKELVTVADGKETIHKKFYKSEFGDVMTSPDTGMIVQELLDAAYIKR